MLVRKTFQKTKVFFRKTIQNLNSFLNRKHRKLPKSPSLNLNHTNSAQLFENFYDTSEPQYDDKMVKTESTPTLTKEAINEKIVHFESFKNGDEKIIMKSKHDEREIKEDKKMGSYREDKGENCSKIARGGGYVLARKMKELEQTETLDMDQVLDIEEVLHYYSCLTSPCYLDIVDKFYIDMHSEFLVPQPSKSVNNSSRRLGPLKI